MVMWRAIPRTYRLLMDLSLSRSALAREGSGSFLPHLPWAGKIASLWKDALQKSDDYVRKNITKVISLIALFAVVISFLPLYRDDTISLDNTYLYDGVHSKLYQVTVIAAIAVPWSGIIDCILDNFDRTLSQSNESSERLVLLLCLIIPNVYVALYHYFFPDYANGMQIFVIIKYLHEVLYLSPCIIIGVHRDENHFSPTALVFLYATYVCSNVLKSNTLSGDNPHFLLVSAILYYFSFGPALMYFVYFWFKIYGKIIKGTVTANETVNCVMSLSITSLGISLVVINYATGQLDYPQFGSINLSASLLARIFFTLSVTVLPGRLSKYLWQRSRHKLNMKSLFVRYVGHEIRWES